MTDLQPNFTAIKHRQQQIWSAGDFANVGTHLMMVSELLCEAIDLHPNSTVLDVATGGGITALAAARRFAITTGIDYVPALLERARELAAAERLDVTFLDGDAEDLQFEDTTFDVTLSTFGVMFAPNQARAAAELLRVTRPGGTIGLACWTPEGFVGGMFRATAKHMAPPPGLHPPTRWGTEAGLADLLGPGLRDLQVNRRQVTFRFPSPEAWLGFFNRYFGPVKTAFESLEPIARTAYAADLLANVQTHNRATDGTMIVPSEYLEVVAIRA